MSVIADEQSPLFLTNNQNYVLAQIEKEEDGNANRDPDEQQSLSDLIS